jgi:hypothetical protein
MPGSRYAVLIGSSIFPQEPKLQPLNAPEKDVDGLAAVLSSPERGCFSDISILKNRPQSEIIRSIQRTFNRACRDDLVVLYYSGHGKLNRSGRLYLTALDTALNELESSAIAVSSIRDFVDVSESRKVVIILDCCFSGAVGGVFSKGSIDDQLQSAAREGRGTYIMTASTGIQTALEKETDQHSIFTKHLIAGIKSGEADKNRDGTITVDELYDYLYPRVREESHQQPTKWSMDTRGLFVIANSGRKPSGPSGGLKFQHEAVIETAGQDTLITAKTTRHNSLTIILGMIILIGTIIAVSFDGSSTNKELQMKAPAEIAELIKNAEQGNAEAQNNLATIYYEGIGLPQDRAKAKEWYQKAANQGYAKAQHRLGWMYQTGEGMFIDEAKAVEWYRRAAEQGDADAQVKLGWMYYYGKGVPIDRVKAEEWYWKASEQGNGTARSYLDMLYKR